LKAIFENQILKAYQLKIHGLVQGVFFRKHTLDKAREYGVNGYVRNCDDGSVEVHAEGNENQVMLLISWCKKGPGKSRVEKVDIHERPLKNFTEFIITH